jgi:hypothetical protein
VHATGLRPTRFRYREGASALRVDALPPWRPPDTRINPAMNDDVDDRLSELVSAVNDDARVLLEAVAQVPDTRMNMEKLTEVSGVRNVGAALQSLKIQRTRLNVASPIEKRRTARKMDATSTG